MKMKRIGTILLALLMLISFTACNLDNSGILYRGPNRTPSDNKNRNYIGQTSDTVYFVTSDGLSQAKLNGTSLTDDQVISSNPIFQHYFQGHGWMVGNDIVWLEDNQGEQNYYLITPTTDPVGITKLEVKYGTETTELKTPKYLYRYYSDDYDPYLVVKEEKDSNAVVYTATVNAETKTLTLTQVLNMDTSFDSSEDLDFNYSGSVNGLLWSTITSKDDSGKETTTTTYMYALPDSNGSSTTPVTVTFSHDVTSEDETPTTEEVTVAPSTIKSVYEKDGYLFVLTSSSSQITIYSNYVTTGNPGTATEGNLTLKELATVSASYNSSFPIYYRDGKLIFLDYNISDSSVMYFVDLTRESETASDSLSSGIEAEAFIQFPSQPNVFMMTKNHGFFRLTDNSVSEI